MSNFKIEDFTPAPQNNEYDEAVKALIDAGEGKALTISVPTADADKHKRRFGEAATRAGKSARQRKRTQDGDVTNITFTLGAKITQNRKPKPDAENAPATDAENAPATDAENAPADVPEVSAEVPTDAPAPKSGKPGRR